MRGDLMNARVILIAVILALLIIGGGAYWAYDWFSTIYAPAIEMQEAQQKTQTVFAQQTAQEATQYAYGTQTLDAEISFCTQTAQAVFSQQTQMSLNQESTHAAVMTMTAQPTVTPEIKMTCDARVINDNSLLNTVPGYSQYLDEILYLNDGDRITVDGMILGSEWYHVNYDDQVGFMQSKNVLFIDPKCSVGFYDLHFMANWLKSGWHLLVEDNFASNEYIWLKKDGNVQFTPTLYRQRGFLRIVSDGEAQIFSTPKLRKASFSTVQIHVNYSSYPSLKDGYFGFRFYEEDDSYHELRFNRIECTYSGFENSRNIFTNNVKKEVCNDIYYDLIITIVPSGTIEITINGKPYGPVPFIDADQDLSISDIYFVVSGMTAEINYVIVSAPK
jgi:hypothetical protein